MRILTQPCGMIAGISDIGVVALTPCCQALAKGSGSGVVCRGCYEAVDVLYGITGWESLLQAAKDVGCPCPHDCADYVLWKLTAEEYE